MHQVSLTGMILPPRLHTVISGRSHLSGDLCSISWGGRSLPKLFGIFLHGILVSFPTFIYSIIKISH